MPQTTLVTFFGAPLPGPAPPLAKRASKRAPDDAAFFADAAYQTLAANELSTSVLTIEHCRQSGFGPVHPDGYGVSYHVPPDELRFCTTTYAPRSAEAFNAELSDALRLVGELLSQHE